MFSATRNVDTTSDVCGKAQDRRELEVDLFGCGLLAQRRIIGIASGTTAVESLDVPPVERRPQREPARQIGIRQEKLAEGDRVRLAGGQSRFGLFARKTLVGDIDPAERRLERGSQPWRRARFARADEGDFPLSQFA